MEHDPDRIEDVLKVDAVEGDPMTGDDAYDETRYFLMSRPAVSDAPPLSKPEKEVKAMEDYALAQHQRKKDVEKGMVFNDDPWAQGTSLFDDEW